MSGDRLGAEKDQSSLEKTVFKDSDLQEIMNSTKLDQDDKDQIRDAEANVN